MKDYRALHQLFVVAVIAMVAAGCSPSNDGAVQAPKEDLQADKDAITATLQPLENSRRGWRSCKLRERTRRTGNDDTPGSY